MTDKKVINRIKVVLAENDRTNRWLAEAIGKNEATVSRWCSNKAQPSIDVFRQIAEALDVDGRELLHTTKK
jgi:transcriptional regulator with XRE-family HTH domain